MSDYGQFLATKRIIDVPTGKECEPTQVHELLFDFQRLIVAWAVKRGRAAIFADCGLGKTLMQLEWARIVGGRCLIVAPLCVSQQTIREAKKINLAVRYCKSQADCDGGISITNYERIEGFDASKFDAVVLDESSILKGLDGATRKTLTEMFAQTPYRLCCTATPAPNDISEIANHSEFLGVMTRAELLSMFFVHDEQDWRLKGHSKDAFWRWVVSWAICMRSPADIGCDATRFILPKLNYHAVSVETDWKQSDMLFGVDVVGLQGRIRARAGTVAQRVEAAANIVNESKEQWVLWCGLNNESKALTTSIPGAVEICGADSLEHKEQSILGFIDGSIRVIVTKSKIAGFGVNLQNCHNVMFVGLSDSYEAYYQAVRRCWRFGQKKPVSVYIVTADVEGPVVANVKSKEKEAEQMHKAMVENMRELKTQEIKGQHKETVAYRRDVRTEKEWTMHLGDSCEVVKEIPDDSIDFSVCSPPFAALYTYSNTERDMGNCKSEDEFLGHYEFLVGEWLRITKPGRLAAIHVSNVPAMLSRDGFIGLKDFRGSVIRAHQRTGWIFHGEFTVDKNPQAQAIRTKAKGLTFSQLERDAAWMRPALADYVLLFRKDGENAVPVKPDVTRDEWIEYAHPCWRGISETDTLTVAEAREEKDERHICPLQLGLIDRAVRLWSNQGETVFSPFAGIGSEGYQSLLRRRHFIGIELKENYWRVACGNLLKAIQKRSEGLLFSETETA